jgi:hypothetical protein
MAGVIRQSVPDVVIIDLSRLPSHGREVAVWLRGRKATRHVPLIFVDGEPEKVERVRELLPDALFIGLAQLRATLKKVAAKTARGEAPAKDPIVPPQIMDRYGSRTAAQKMGIRAGSTVGVLDAPRNYAPVLGEMPENTEFSEDAEEVHPVTIWFVHEPEPFLSNLRQMRAMAGKTKLWILWRKGQKNGMTQNFIREAAIDAGLVDYKICAVDGTWSAIALARRKK